MNELLDKLKELLDASEGYEQREFNFNMNNNGQQVKVVVFDGSESAERGKRYRIEAINVDTGMDATGNPDDDLDVALGDVHWAKLKVEEQTNTARDFNDPDQPDVEVAGSFDEE